jgi:hypothetical protein
MRQILATKGLTLYKVSKVSADMFGRSSLYFVPQRLYREVSSRDFIPNLFQLVALSCISKYRLVDWLGVFGFRLDDIPKLQCLVPWRNTVLLDSAVYDERRLIPWFDESFIHPSQQKVAPLGQLLVRGSPTRASRFIGDRNRFGYLKVGYEDFFAFPSLAPGSIVRVDLRKSEREIDSGLLARTSEQVFLVENGTTSLRCGHLKLVDENRVALCAPTFPFEQTDLTLSDSVRIVGQIDCEIRPFPTRTKSKSGIGRSQITGAPQLGVRRARNDVQRLIRFSRMRVGLSFREASTLSRWVAKTLADSSYFAAPGTLADYENSAAVPRHIQKCISLCVLYCIDFWSFLQTLGVPLHRLGTEPLSNSPTQRSEMYEEPFRDERSVNPSDRHTLGVLSALRNRYEEVPLFLRDTLPDLVGLKNLSLSDLFYYRGGPEEIHPVLRGASILAVNRRRKIPAQTSAASAWEQPLHIVLMRDGRYVCASCQIRQGTLILQPYSANSLHLIRLRNRIDAEIVGQVAGVLRSL